jgi:flagellar basal body rod protein FlgB
MKKKNEECLFVKKDKEDQTTKFKNALDTSHGKYKRNLTVTAKKTVKEIVKHIWTTIRPESSFVLTMNKYINIPVQLDDKNTVDVEVLLTIDIHRENYNKKFEDLNKAYDKLFVTKVTIHPNSIYSEDKVINIDITRLDVESK